MNLETKKAALLQPLAWFLAGIALVVVPVLLLLGYALLLRPRQWRAELTRSIRAAEPELLAYVRDVRERRIKPGTGTYDAGRYPPPCISGGPSIEAVTIDSHGNVVFRTEHSLQWDVGFEYRNGQAEMRGTGIGTEIMVEHLFGPWYVFDNFGP
jgi:hypothetical protein